MDTWDGGKENSLILAYTETGAVIEHRPRPFCAKSSPCLTAESSWTSIITRMPLSALRLAAVLR